MELEWQLDFETGNEYVDLQHRYFVDLINRVCKSHTSSLRPSCHWLLSGQRPKKRSVWSTVQLYPQSTWKTPNRSA